MKRSIVLLALLLVACGTMPDAATPATPDAATPATPFTPVGLLPWPDGAASSPQIGQRAPNFSLLTAAGQPVTLDSKLGGAMLINFWATWCGPCRAEMPLLERANEHVQVLGIDLQEDAAAVTAFGRAQGVTYPLLLDTDGAVKDAYLVVNLPWTFAVDRRGTIQAIVRGPLTEAKLQELIKLIGSER